MGIHVSGRRLVKHGAILREIEQRQLAKAAIPTVRQMKSLYLRAIASLTASATDDALKNALRTGSLGSGLDWGTFGATLTAGLTELLGSSAKAGITTSFAQAVKVGSTSSIKAAFENIDQEAVDWATAQGGQLMVEVSQGLRAEVNELVAQSLRGVRDTASTAKLIRASIGLTTKQSAWVANAFDANVADGLKNGLEHTDAIDQAMKASQGFANRLLDQRATAIARTEIATATMNGRNIGYEKLFSSGLLDRSQATKTWIADPEGCCDLCQENVDAGAIGFDEAFPSGDMFPPGHPNCECDEGMDAPTGAYDLSSLAS